MTGLTEQGSRPDEIAQQLSEPFGLLKVWKVSGTLEQHHAAVGDHLVGGGRVPGGNHPVPRAPDNEGWDVDAHRQVIMSRDGLSAWIDDPTSRCEKGSPAVGVSQGRKPTPDLGHIQTRPPAPAGKHPSRGFDTSAHPTGRVPRPMRPSVSLPTRA